MPPRALAGEAAEVRVFRRATSQDPIHVVPIAGGGLISYQKSSGLFIHTLNDSEGFVRKVRDLGIQLT